MTTFFTPHQVSRALGVSESTLKRWCDKGVLETVRTAGGHRRVAYEEVARFLRDSGHELVRPELLGLPAAVGQGTTVRNRAVRQLVVALKTGDDAVAGRVVTDLFLSRQPIWQIGDEVVGPALSEIGHAWECGELAVFQERRGCEIAQRVLYGLEQMVPDPPAGSPTAIGGTFEGDPYRLATILCESVLREAGWHAQSFGSSIPEDSFRAAVQELRPRICWLSVSHVADGEKFVAELGDLHRAAQKVGTALVVGGRGFTEEFRRRCDYTVYCERLKDLRSFAETLHPPALPSAPKTAESTDA